MTTKEFLVKIQAYYGMQYPVGQRQEVVKYLAPCGNRYLDILYDRTIRTFSGSYGKDPKLPDIAMFEKLAADVREEIASIPPPYRPAVTDGSEVDYREDIARMFAELRAARKFGLAPVGERDGGGA
jgi:hypothetical protein